MRVGLVMYGADRALGGTTRVAIELGRALRQVPSCEVVYLTPYRQGPFRDEPNTPAYYLPGCGRVPGMLALGGPLVARAARRLRLDVVHDPIGISPFAPGSWPRGCARVLTIFDASAYRYPRGYPWLNAFLHRRHVPRTLPRVDAVVTISEHARSELARFLALPARHITAVPLAASEMFRPQPREEARQAVAALGLDGPYVLGLSGQYKRKNFPCLVSAFAQLHAKLPALRLVIAGPTLWRGAELDAQLARLGLAGAVHVLGYVPDRLLPALYSAAEVFVLPSLYEGFGLPVLEAMACGTPVVCSNVTALPEVAGDAALLVDPTRPAQVAAAVRRVLREPELRALLRARGQARARTFTWERTARETVAVYAQAIAATRGSGPATLR